MDDPSGNAGDIDLRRVLRPQEDAFRTIAEALGATYAGDSERPARRAANDERAAIARLPNRGSAHAVARADPKRARLLDRIPVPMVVADGDQVAFVNRAALATLGFGSAAILDAAGGLGALFGAQSGRDGLVLVRTATGRSFPARVEMAPIDWANGNALLLTVVPDDALHNGAALAPVPRPAIGDPLVALLDAVPIPLAIVTRGGEVEAANRAFVGLGPADRAVTRLDERLNPADLRHLMAVVAHAFEVEDGRAETTWPLMANGQPFWVCAAALARRDIACVSFQRYGSESDGCANAGARPVALAEAAVSEVRRLIGEGSMLLVHRRTAPPAPLNDDDVYAVQCLRAALLATAARAAVGSVLTLESGAERITVSLSPGLSPATFEGIISERVEALARDAGLTFSATGTALDIVVSHSPAARRSA